MKLKTSELTGAALDWAVAKCEGKIDDCNGWLYQATLEEVEEGSYKPSTDWSQGGEIIKREYINIEYPREGYWVASKWLGKPMDFAFGRGETPLIGAMRCYVASKLGDEIEIPEELTNQGERHGYHGEEN